MTDQHDEIKRLQRENRELRAEVSRLEDAEALRRESELEYQTILDHTGTATVVLESDHTIIRANPEYEKLSGYTRAELEGKIPWTHFVAPDELPRMTGYAKDRRTSPGAAPRSYEFTLIDRQGRAHDIFMTVGMIPGTRRNVASLLDLTEPRATEAAARQSELNFAAAFHHLPTAAVITDLETGLFVEVNRAFETLSGHTAAELLGKTSLQTGLWLDSAARQRVVGRVKRDGAVRGLNREMHTRNGEIKQISMWAVKIKLGGQDRMLGAYVDLTEQLASERFQAAVLATATNMGLGIFIERASFTHEARMVYVNKALADMVGKRRGDIVGKLRLQDLVHEDSQGLIADIIRGHMSGERPPSRFDAGLKGADGAKLTVEVALSSTEIEGQPALVGFCQDVSLTRKMEEQAQAKQRLESLGSLAGGIAHDFNNLLMSISGYAEMTQMTAAGHKGLNEAMAGIIKACGRGRELVRQIITFSRGDHLSPHSVAVRELAGDTLNLVEASLPPGIKLVREFSATRDTVLADPAHINQLLTNLCTNAAQAMGPGGGDIRVRLGQVELTDSQAAAILSLQPGEHLLISVVDNGPGIPPEVVEKVFDPFFTTKPAGEGTGMGLAVVHGIVQSLGGAVEVEGRPGQGAAFHIWLPLSDAPPKPAPAESPGPHLGGEKILVVEDDKDLAEVMTSLLGELGYGVTLAGNGEEGLERFTADVQAFDLVISDQTMPVMTGTDMAKKMLEMRPELPIILATGYGGGLSQTAAQELGLAAVILKPFRINQIAELIRNVLES